MNRHRAQYGRSLLKDHAARKLDFSGGVELEAGDCDAPVEYEQCSEDSVDMDWDLSGTEKRSLT
ncbi:MAG: hypothetical protein AB2L09_12235 [Coriobacteriia bacterium]